MRPPQLPTDFLPDGRPCSHHCMQSDTVVSIRPWSAPPDDNLTQSGHCTLASLLNDQAIATWSVSGHYATGVAMSLPGTLDRTADSAASGVHPSSDTFCGHAVAVSGCLLKDENIYDTTRLL